MLTSDQTARIADAILCLRPNWTKQMVLGTLQNATIANRAARDVAIAFTACAVDHDTKHPNRLLERGPWWDLVKWTDDTTPAYRYADPRDCTTCGRAQVDCRKDGHDYVPIFTRHDERATPDQIAAVRAVIQTKEN